MITPAISPQEEERLKALRQLHILDTPVARHDLGVSF